MPMTFSTYTGTGRATCKLCLCKIKKTEQQITAVSGWGWNTSRGSIHADQKLCELYRSIKRQHELINLEERHAWIIGRMKEQISDKLKAELENELNLIHFVTSQSTVRR